MNGNCCGLVVGGDSAECFLSSPDAVLVPGKDMMNFFDENL